MRDTRPRYTETDRQRQTETEKQTDIGKDRQGHKDRDRQTNRQRHIQSFVFVELLEEQQNVSQSPWNPLLINRCLDNRWQQPLNNA